MAEREYEFDEYGGHKPYKVDGGEAIPMFGCAGGCPASFFTNDARVAHIKTMHPGVSSGPTPDMIHLARIRPELAEAFGIDHDQLWAPMNVHEFEEENRMKDVLNTQENRDKITSHPAWRHFQDLMSNVRMLHAAGLAENSSDSIRERLDECVDQIKHHGEQFVAGTAIGKSIWRDHTKHIGEVDYQLDNMLAYVPESQYKHHDKLVSDSLNKMYFAQWKPGEYDPHYDKYREPYEG